MDLSITHQQSQRLLKQRNLLAGSCLILFGVSVMLTLLPRAFWRARGPQRAGDRAADLGAWQP